MKPSRPEKRLTRQDGGLGLAGKIERAYPAHDRQLRPRGGIENRDFHPLKCDKIRWD